MYELNKLDNKDTARVKSQTVRLIDVGILGPLMMAVSASEKPPKWARGALFITGIATMLYNAANYRTIEAQNAAKRS